MKIEIDESLMIAIMVSVFIITIGSCMSLEKKFYRDLRIEEIRNGGGKVIENK